MCVCVCVCVCASSALGRTAGQSAAAGESGGRGKSQVCRQVRPSKKDKQCVCGRLLPLSLSLSLSLSLAACVQPAKKEEGGAPMFFYWLGIFAA